MNLHTNYTDKKGKNPTDSRIILGYFTKYMADFDSRIAGTGFFELLNVEVELLPPQHLDLQQMLKPQCVGTWGDSLYEKCKTDLLHRGESRWHNSLISKRYE